MDPDICDIDDDALSPFTAYFDGSAAIFLLNSLNHSQADENVRTLDNAYRASEVQIVRKYNRYKHAEKVQYNEAHSTQNLFRKAQTSDYATHRAKPADTVSSQCRT